MSLKRINRKHIVTVDGTQFVFDSMRKALQYIFEKRGIQ